MKKAPLISLPLVGLSILIGVAGIFESIYALGLFGQFNYNTIFGGMTSWFQALFLTLFAGPGIGGLYLSAPIKPSEQNILFRVIAFNIIGWFILLHSGRWTLRAFYFLSTPKAEQDAAANP